VDREEDMKALSDAFAELKRDGSGNLILADSSKMPDVLRFMADRKIDPARIEKQEATLEDIFLETIAPGND
ncbi:MAG: DUF4162 domain-containing protein, partial [Lachnospiraceae bacterium]|nr:DUF4162 domain-containing protein [Lachnospiraceae bacterium]